MNTLIQILKNALVQSDTFMDNLHSEDGYYFRKDYTVAVVHHKKRIKEGEIIDCLNHEGFLNVDGYTPNDYNEQMLRTFASCAPMYVKQIGLICSSTELEESYRFQEKRLRDYWKKVVDPGNFEALIEYSEYKDGEDICKIEFELRELMRSSKEVPSLKVLPYIWVVIVSKSIDISKIMHHYFGENFEQIESNDETMAIGWSTTLQEINMRYFVCPPNEG